MKQLPQDIINEILKYYPEYSAGTCIEYIDVLEYRLKLIEKQLQSQTDLINDTDKEILKSIQDNEFISKNIYPERNELSFGQRSADTIAKFGGSWKFIILFILVLVTWIILNVTSLLFEPFDRYPFVLLNLALSCLAAIQAPIIMISQNRREERDREQSLHDYEVNLKSEIEVRLLHEKMDHLIFKQMKQLNEIQQLQLERLKEIERIAKKHQS